MRRDTKSRFELLHGSNRCSGSRLQRQKHSVWFVMLDAVWCRLLSAEVNWTQSNRSDMFVGAYSRRKQEDILNCVQMLHTDLCSLVCRKYHHKKVSSDVTECLLCSCCLSTSTQTMRLCCCDLFSSISLNINTTRSSVLQAARVHRSGPAAVLQSMSSIYSSSLKA